MDSTPVIFTVKLASIIPSLMLAGYTVARYGYISRLYDERPQISTSLFKTSFRHSGKWAVPMCQFMLLASAYLAYFIPEKRKLWIVAADMAIGELVWTRFAMFPGIQRIIAISEDEKVQKKCEQTLEHRQLMTTWAKQNFVRTAFAVVGGMAGLWASMA